jgi:hypothetical protein
MADPLQGRWDQSKFDRTFARSLDFTDRDLVTAINTTSYYVARKATWFTHKADRGKIEAALGKRITVPRVSVKFGKARIVNRRELQLTQARDSEAPVAALIINKRRGKGNGLHGREMVRAIRQMIAARLRSVAYTKSGWIPSIRALSVKAEKAGAPPMDTAAKVYGRAKGSAFPAVSLHSKSAATLINEAWAKHDKNNAFYRYGSQGLQRAFNDETAHMERRIKEKMLAIANGFNAAQK